MKKSVLIFLLGISVLSFGQKANPPAPRKLALIVAIGDYDRNATGWFKISSANDVPLVKGALVKIGFKEEDISVLLDQQATRGGILSSLKAITDKAKAGDMIIVHISSHGQQISDNDPSGSDESDGYDEAIIAFGAPASDKYKAAKTRGADVPYDGSLHLRDDDLGKAITAIRAKVGEKGHVLAILDACHSGTGTRGSAMARGGEAPYDLQGAPPAKKAGEGEEVGFGIEFNSKAKLGKFVLISGASADEVNYEAKDDDGNGMGSLSYSFSKALPTIEKKDTYRRLFAKICAEMADKAPKQTPQLEGDVDSEIFGDSFTPQPKFIKVRKVVDPKQLTIEAGKLMNVSTGTTVVVKSNLDGKELSKGKVSAANNYDATVVLDSEVKGKSVNMEVYVTGYAVVGKKVLVNLDSVSNAELKAALTNSLSAMGMVEISKGKSDLNVSDAASRGNFVVNVNTTAYGSRLMNKPVTTTNADEAVTKITDLIQNYAQGNTFKGLDMRDDNYKVVIRVLPFKPDGKLEQDTLDVRTFMDKGGVVNFPEGTRLVIQAKNLGTKKAYFNVIDFEPNGKINPVFPPIDRKSGLLKAEPTEFALEPGAPPKTFVCCPMGVTPPYGNEIFKVFATGIPFDLSSTINTKGAEVGTRGRGPTPLEKMMGKTYEKASTRGTETEEVVPEDMGTNSHEYTFKIVKKK